MESININPWFSDFIILSLLIPSCLIRENMAICVTLFNRTWEEVLSEQGPGWAVSNGFHESHAAPTQGLRLRRD